jgi:UDP-N-acetylmuramoyl-L-alanyl-D-glutamate--2,6-diaminopimelate ligase
VSSAFGDAPAALKVQAIGEVFAENALAALAAAVASGVPASAAASAITRADPPPGRFEVVRREPHVVVDYAHTPDALARTLGAARRLCSGRLSLVFGAGGERDRDKRPLMGQAARAADRVWLTSDNPRSEDPRAIADAIAEGLADHPDVLVELDRERAIVAAVRGAAAGDVVVLAGKGHETQQQARGADRHLSDAEVALSA